MELKTKIYDLCPSIYPNWTEMAKVMGISVSQVYRVAQGKRHINEKFILGAVKAFPGYALNELFYVEGGPSLGIASVNYPQVTLRELGF